MSRFVVPICLLSLVLSTVEANELNTAIKSDYDAH